MELEDSRADPRIDIYSKVTEQATEKLSAGDSLLEASISAWILPFGPFQDGYQNAQDAEQLMTRSTKAMAARTRA